jgi:myo-inositol catabolism protein IolC
MIRKIKQWLNVYQTNKELTHELVNSYIKIQNLQHKVADPKEVINRIFSQGIEWYDWNQLPPEQQRQAYRDAQHFLNSDIVNNIKNHLLATGAQRALLEETHDTNKIRDFQMIVTGITLLQQELEEIIDPDSQSKKPTTKVLNG